MQLGRAGALLAVIAVALLARVRGGEPALVAVQSAPGRFEIAATDSSRAHAIAAEAESAWRHLAAPLGLPDAFPSPVFVRLVPSSAAAERFQAMVEPGGVVSVRVPASAPLGDVRRGLVHGLLLRLAVTHYGADARLAVPLWLEHGCVGWWQTRADAARMDALRYEAARVAPPELSALLTWRRGAEEPRALVNGAMWLVTFLQAESNRGREWLAFLRQALGGVESEQALTAAFAGRFGAAGERELWWQTGWHHARRVRVLPMLDAAESRVQLGNLARFVFAAANEDADAVVPLAEVVGRASEQIVAIELARRGSELATLIPLLHPFYRNAGLSLTQAFGAASAKDAVQRQELCRAFEQDWWTAIELEAATRTALDALEAGATRAER